MFAVKQVPVSVCNFIDICLRCVEKGAFAFIVYVGKKKMGFPECLLFLDSDNRLNQ